MTLDELAKEYHVLPLAEAKERYGDNDTTYQIFYETLLSATDYKVFQHIREKALATTLSLTDEEYIALETLRQECVDNIRLLKEKVGG